MAHWLIATCIGCLLFAHGRETTSGTCALQEYTQVVSRLFCLPFSFRHMQIQKQAQPAAFGDLEVQIKFPAATSQHLYVLIVLFSFCNIAHPCVYFHTFVQADSLGRSIFPKSCRWLYTLLPRCSHLCKNEQQ